jgi:hypothetical protein
MITKTTHDNAATVAPDLHWIPLTERQPGIGTRVLVIDEQQRIAYLRAYQPRQGWTHFFPLPTFFKDEK